MALTPDQQRRARTRRMNMLMAYAAAFASTKGFTPSSLFAAGEQGVWYDPSDFSTMFQDSTGTTPVTAVGQPVGLILDKSRGLAFGNQIVDNPGFDSDTVWSKSTGWTISGGVASRGPQATGNSITQSMAFVAGVTYRITFTVTTVNAGQFRIRITGGTDVLGTLRSTPGTYTEYLTAVTGNNTFGISAWTAATDGSIDNISVQALPGNHALQATSAARPILQQDASGRFYLDFDGTDDSLATSAIDFSATDNMSVFAGLRKLNDAANNVVFELGDTSAAGGGTAGILAPAIATANSYSFGIRGAGLGAIVRATAGGYVAPTTNVMSATAGISADSVVLRVNGVQVATSAAENGGGNLGNQPIYIGARVGGTFPFTGRIYSLIVLGRTATASEIASTEAWVNSRTGAF